MTIEQIMTAVSQVGFPIVVALYSLVRLERTVRANTKVITIIATKMGVEVAGNVADGE